MMEIFLKNWQNSFFEELQKTKRLRIVSPYISKQVIRQIQQKFNFQNFELITRFNLNDFASKVSSLDALSFSLEHGAQIYGTKDLHSKIYLFDDRTAIITSANLTTGGLVHNYECGIVINDVNVIANLSIYFEELKSKLSNQLTSDLCRLWQLEIANLKFDLPLVKNLPDYGYTPFNNNSDTNSYVKFFGTSDNRVGMNFTVKEEIERSLCHYACGFSINKKPRQFQSGDILYFARLTDNPVNIAIFGRAEAIKFNDQRDKATQQEITERPWKRHWPIYLRVTNPIFIDGTMLDCVFLYDLIDDLKWSSFQTTETKFLNGKRDINPYKSLRQQPYVKLSEKASTWLESRFYKTLEIIGQVEQPFIDSLPKSEFEI